jgi:hypothetical protein
MLLMTSEANILAVLFVENAFCPGHLKVRHPYIVYWIHFGSSK